MTELLLLLPLAMGILTSCGYGFGGVRLPEPGNSGADAALCIRITDVADNFSDSERTYIEVKRTLYETLTGAGHQDCAGKPRRDIRIQKWSLGQTITSYNATATPREARIVAALEAVSETPSALPTYYFTEDTYVDYAAQAVLQEQKRIAAAKDLMRQIALDILRSPLAQPDPAPKS